MPHGLVNRDNTVYFINNGEGIITVNATIFSCINTNKMIKEKSDNTLTLIIY